MAFVTKCLRPHRHLCHRSGVDGSTEDSMLTKNRAHGQTQKILIERDRCQVAIDTLPDDILLCIFNVYMEESYYPREVWHTLVHVCRRWRILVFGSPRHLNVQLCCSIQTPTTKKLDTWPTLPIFVYNRYYQKGKIDNLIAAIKHNDRVCKIDIGSFFDVSLLEEVLSVMQVPFPVLTDLRLVLEEVSEIAKVIPDSFLGGSAPRLQRLHLEGTTFPGLPKLLLSATDLVSIQLRHLYCSRNISPDAMATCLSALPRLKLFTLEFSGHLSYQDWESRHLPPPTRTLLPALTLLRFKGIHEYAEDLVSRIDAPLLHRLYITFFDKTVPNIPHLSRFVNRIPKFQALDEARVTFTSNELTVTLPLPIRTIGYEGLVLGISWDNLVGPLSSLAQLCRSFSRNLAMVKQLYIYGDGSLRSHWPVGIQNSHWLELLQLFTGAKNLYLVSEDLALYISPTLRELVGERTTEVLPALQNLFLKRGPASEDIETFVAARQLSGHPIAVSHWLGW